MTGIVKLDEIQNNAGTTTLAKLENGVLTGALSPATGFRNRIINGDMRIDQRNDGAALTIGVGAYSVDRWLPQENSGATITAQQSTVAPAGFVNSLLMTVSTGATSASGEICRVSQRIEGLNVSDLAWGTADAKTITISFWVRSSITGTYCVGIMNSALNRSYAAEYTISSADTWEYKTVTVAGDTSGTWLTTNGIGIWVLWDLGSGSNFDQTAGSWSGTQDWKTSNQTDWSGTTGATFYITGVQLEKGSVATPFDFRSIGQELGLCQRYYESFASNPMFVGQSNASTGVRGQVAYSEKRAAPTITANSLGVANDNISSVAINSIAFSSTTTKVARFDCTLANSDLVNNSICYADFGYTVTSEL